MLAGDVGPKSSTASPSLPFRRRVSSPRPLERRLPAAAPGPVCSCADAPPRKKRNNEFATDPILVLCCPFLNFYLVNEGADAGTFAGAGGLTTEVTGVDVPVGDAAAA